ncbi:MAG: ATP synthase subunit I [Motiliproteus sp.]
MDRIKTAQNTGSMIQQQRNQIIILILSQTLLTLAATLVAWLSVGKVAGYSALLGGLIYLIPFTYQACRVLISRPGAGIRQNIWVLYKSEIWKMALTMAGFGVVFVLVKPIEPFSLFGVFILMQLSAWLTPLILNYTLFKN